MTPTSIFEIRTPEEFREKALEIFRYQAEENPVYRKFIRLLGRNPSEITQPGDIPFLPISFFKTHQVLSGQREAEMVFTSSGTTGSATSRHLVADLAMYRQSFRKAFQRFHGKSNNYRILALLPGYLEREGSSLIFMVHDLIETGGHPESGFFLHDHQRLRNRLQELEARALPTLLIGVSHALLDFAEKYELRLKHTIVMETGGMKGRRKELIREELHDLLRSRFHVPVIPSEYGMTGLLSQAYSRGQGRCYCPPWMQIRVRELHDPFAMVPPGRSGGINVIDLANVHSCSFIATDDLGKLHPDGSFEVLGRFDNSDIRGCNLLVT